MDEVKEALSDKSGLKLLNAKRGTENMPIVEFRDWVWSSDTMFYDLRGKSRAIFCAIEMTTRIGYVRLYKHLNQTAEECKGFLQELYDKYPMTALNSDPGIEYDNKTVKSWCKSNGVKQYFYDVGEKTEKAVIERFNRSIRDLLNAYVLKLSWDWSKALPEIESFYNNRFHRSIGKAPIMVSYQDMEKIRTKASSRSKEYLKKLNSFTPGLHVRVWIGADPKKSIVELATQNFAKKSGVNWTTDVYTVEGTEGYKVTLNETDRRFSPRDLLVIPASEIEEVEAIDDVAVEEKKKRKTRRRLNKEGLFEASEAIKRGEEKHEPARRPTRSSNKIEHVKDFDVNQPIASIEKHRGSDEKFELLAKYSDATEKWLSIPSMMINPINQVIMMNYLKKHSLIRASRVKDYLA